MCRAFGWAGLRDLVVSTVGTMTRVVRSKYLHVSVLYVDHLQVETFNLQISYTRCVGHLDGREIRDLVVSTVGTVTRVVRSEYLHVSVLYVDHLQVETFNLQISYTRCVGAFGWVGGTRSRCFNIGYRDPSC